MANNIAVIGKATARELVEITLTSSDIDLFKMLAPDIKHHFISQLAGIHKNLYMRADGTVGHTDIENFIKACDFDKARKAAGK